MQESLEANIAGIVLDVLQIRAPKRDTFGAQKRPRRRGQFVLLVCVAFWRAK
jgi:hypothetical protein